jgi:hypothetical protein
MHKQQFNSYHTDSAVTVVSTETVEQFQATIDEYSQTGFPLPDLNSTNQRK